ncbi:hypothetical protein Gpo141_00007752 [Globisporangium polare]
MSTSAGDKKFYVLQYSYTADILEKRDPFRPEHLALAKALKAEGKVVMAGALLDPVDAAIFIFHTADKRDIEEFVKKDPYVKNKLVTTHSIREWGVAV